MRVVLLYLDRQARRAVQPLMPALARWYLRDAFHPLNDVRAMHPADAAKALKRQLG